MSGTNEPDLFVDGLLDVSFSRGIVRCDFYSLSATEKVPTGGPKPEFRKRLVMSAGAFVEFVNSVNLAAQSLRERGALPAGPQPVPQPAPLRPVEAEPAEAASAEPAEPAAETGAVVSLGQPRQRPRSPNFPPSSTAETPTT